jgi:hypothetical protein
LRPLHGDVIREMAEDIAIGGQTSPGARAIADHIVKRRQGGVRLSSQKERLQEAMMILRAIQANILGADVAALTKPGNMEWWMKRED